MRRGEKLALPRRGCGESRPLIACVLPKCDHIPARCILKLQQASFDAERLGGRESGFVPAHSRNALVKSGAHVGVSGAIKWRRMRSSLICNFGCDAKGAIAGAVSGSRFSTSAAAAIVRSRRLERVVVAGEKDGGVARPGTE